MSAPTDLLHAVAHAAGYQVARVSNDGQALLLVGVQEPWNPLASDGDALRLAVKLRITPFLHQDEVSAGHCYEPYGEDACAATRRAIVIAAAEIGRALQPNHESPANSKPGCTGEQE